MTFQDDVKNIPPRVKKAREYAIFHHNRVNQLYDGKPYGETHLEMVFDFTYKYLYLLPNELREDALCGSWMHDLIEDTGLTYNDIKAVFGKDLAEIVFALSNEKGRTRKERANNKYYRGIRKHLVAKYLKICDRLANVYYSKNGGTSMFEAYYKESENFKKQITKTNWLATLANRLLGIDDPFKPMFDQIDDLFNV